MSQTTGFKLCPECRTEYRLVAATCVDCGVDLVDGGAALADDPTPETFPPASELTCVRVAPLPWVRALSGALQQRGVAHRVEPATAADAPEGQRPDVFGGEALFGLYLREGDAAGAREIDGGIAAQLLPEEAPPLDEGEDDDCPACGATLPADATACPDCELPFG